MATKMFSVVEALYMLADGENGKLDVVSQSKLDRKS